MEQQIVERTSFVESRCLQRHPYFRKNAVLKEALPDFPKQGREKKNNSKLFRR